MAPVNAHVLSKAESLKPTLKSTPARPRGLITVHKDDTALMGWTARPVVEDSDLKPLVRGDEVILDFGGHRAGYFEFDVVGVPHGVDAVDAPARLRLVFGEVLNDVAESFEPYTGWMSRSWLPDEIINVDFLPQHVHMPRRHAFRYVKIEVIDTSKRFGVRFKNCLAHAVTSAPLDNPPALTFTNAPNMNEGAKRVLRKIDKVALETLRNCMQTVYEDGPRRDMRLWLGDLRLQALCSYSTFKDYDLAKRCLYLFAALPFNEEGLLCSCLYEKPEPHSGGTSIVDYTLLYGVALLDYVKASGDWETGRELFAVALKQFEIAFRNVSHEYLYIVPEGASKEGGSTWHFIDWHDDLDRTTSVHAIIVFGLKSIIQLADLLGHEYPTLKTSLASEPISVPTLVERMTLGSRRHHFDPKKRVFISGPHGQVSWASQAWAVIAGIPETQEQAAEALKVAYGDPASIQGNTPYVHHYLCEAFVLSGLKDLAVKHITAYWGSMVAAGAETFFEAWDPKRPRFSPYGDLHVNSFCHAWSCTPALLLRQLDYA